MFKNIQKNLIKKIIGPSEYFLIQPNPENIWTGNDDAFVQLYKQKMLRSRTRPDKNMKNKNKGQRVDHSAICAGPTFFDETLRMSGLCVRSQTSLPVLSTHHCCIFLP